MTILVSYDIENDRLRQKTADKLLEYGLIRLQKSVFAGDIHPTKWKAVLVWLEKEVVSAFAAQDRMLYLPLTEFQEKDLVFIPEAPPEWAFNQTPPNTLFM